MDELSLTRRQQMFANEMTPALQTKIAAIQKIQLAVASTTLPKYFQVCREIVSIVEDPEKYGGEGLKQVSAYLGIGIRSLHYKVLVARTWDKAEVTAMSKVSSVSGASMSPSVLEVLSSAPNADCRQEYFEMWRDEGLSRDALRRCISECLAPSHVADDLDGDVDGDEDAPGSGSSSSSKPTVKKRLSKWVTHYTRGLEISGDLLEEDLDELPLNEPKTQESVTAALLLVDKSLERLTALRQLLVQSSSGGVLTPDTPATPSMPAEADDILEPLEDLPPLESGDLEPIDSLDDDLTGDLALEPLFETQEKPAKDAGDVDSVLGEASAKPAKKRSTKKKPAKKAPAKKAPAKKAAAKKAAAKKAATKKGTVKKGEAKPAEPYKPTLGNILKKKPAAGGGGNGPKANRRRG